MMIVEFIIRNSILTQICRKDHNVDNNPNYTFRLLLNEKLYVKGI